MFLKHKISYFAIGVIAIVFLAGNLYFIHKKITKVKAAATNNVMGFAWSGNIGWISFNSLNCDIDGDEKMESGEGMIGCPSIGSVVKPYGVNIILDPDNPVYEQLSGYAWSENVGWISFDKIKTYAPPGEPYNNDLQNYIAKYDFGNNKFYGWARVLSSCLKIGWNPLDRKCVDSGAGSMSGDWDGWIKLSKDAADSGPDYGVFLDDADFKGWAWGGDVVGWVSFNSTNCDSVAPFGQSDGGIGCPIMGTPMSVYKVYINNTPPAVENLQIIAPNDDALCSAGSPVAYRFEWDSIDVGGGQSKFQLQIDNNSDFSSPTVDRTVVISPPVISDSNHNIQSVPLITAVDSPNADNVSYGVRMANPNPNLRAYHWRVKVWDDLGIGSIWKEGASFATPAHRYPDVNFNSLPRPLNIFIVNRPVLFCADNKDNPYDCSTNANVSVCYDDTGSAISCASMIWDFCVNDACADKTGNGEQIYHTYSKSQNYNVKLTVSDSDNSCSIIKSLKPLKPNWKEISPK